jgi:hypothetical protein
MNTSSVGAPTRQATVVDVAATTPMTRHSRRVAAHLRSADLSTLSIRLRNIEITSTLLVGMFCVIMVHGRMTEFHILFYRTLDRMSTVSRAV